MVVIPKIGVLGCRYWADFLPTLLQGAEVVVGLLQRVIGSDDFLQLVKDTLLLSQILHLLFLKVFVLLGTVGLEDAESCIETLLNGVFRMLEAFGFATAFEELVKLVVHILLVQLIEMETNGRNLVLDILNFSVLHEFLKHLHQLQFIETLKFDIVFHQFFLVHFWSILDFGNHLIGHRCNFRLNLSNQGIHFDSDFGWKNARLDQLDNLLFLVRVNGLLGSFRRNLFILNSFVNDGILI